MDSKKGPAIINPAGQASSELVKEVMAQYGIEQGEVRFREAGTWMLASETSAVVAMETNLRTRTTLEYGEGADYRNKIEDPERHYIHVFYLRNLKSDATYPIRMMAEDRNGQRAVSREVSLRTRSMPDVIRIPEDLQGPPYELDRPDTQYLVTEDIIAPKTAFSISASGVTLDLGGHTISYNEVSLELPTDSAETQIEQSAFGIRILGAEKNVKIFNGILRQGKGNDEASDETIGFNPIYLCDAGGSEIAGVTCIYSGPQLSGIQCHHPGPNIRIHHNVVEDLGKLITNRHRKCSAIRLASEEGGTLYNNLVKRARQCAFANVGKHAEVHHNEVHIESYSINSFGIDIKDHTIVHDNKIFGCGDNVVGLVTTGDCANVKLYKNTIWLHAHDITEVRPYLNLKEMESTPYSVMSGVRITWGCKDVDYHDNTILVTARDGGRIRGTFLYNDENVKNAAFRNNLVIALVEDDKSTDWGAIAGVGNGTRGPTEPMLFERNTVVSNFANFNMQDTYGVSTNYRFVRNTFVKVGDRPDYATIKARAGLPSTGHVFLDSHFEGGAGYDQLAIGAEDAFTVQWALHLSAPADVQVAIQDVTGQTVFTGQADTDGKLTIPLCQYFRKGDRRTERTPHTITVSKGRKTTTTTVTMDKQQEIEIGI